MNADVGFIVVQVVLHLALGLIANVYPSQPLHVTRLLVGVPVGLLLICEVFWCDNRLHTCIIVAINITAIIIIRHQQQQHSHHHHHVIIVIHHSFVGHFRPPLCLSFKTSSQRKPLQTTLLNSPPTQPVLQTSWSRTHPHPRIHVHRSNPKNKLSGRASTVL
jgi:hypothetical protein